MDVNWEVNDLLKTAGRQAASFLALMQATEALLEARKFEAFSRMSAFVVHDLKNIVTQLSLMVKNAKRLSHNPEFQADMLMTVENSLDRMRQLMLQLREGAAPGRGGGGRGPARIAHEPGGGAPRAAVARWSSRLSAAGGDARSCGSAGAGDRAPGEQRAGRHRARAVGVAADRALRQPCAGGGG